MKIISRQESSRILERIIRERITKEYSPRLSMAAGEERRLLLLAIDAEVKRELRKNKRFGGKMS